LTFRVIFNNSYIVVHVLLRVVILTAIFGIILLLVYKFGNRIFWCNSLHVKRRGALFLLAMPTNIQYFLECPTPKYPDILEGKTEHPTAQIINDTSGFPVLRYFLIPLSIFTIVVTPMLFARLIRKRVI
jgi:hypothetical protein